MVDLFTTLQTLKTMVNILHQTLTIFALSLLLNSCFAQENIVVKDYEEYFEDVREIELDGKFFEVSYEGDENAERVFLNAYLESPENRGLDIHYRKSGSKLIVEVVGDLSGGWKPAAGIHETGHNRKPSGLPLRFDPGQPECGFGLPAECPGNHIC